MALKNYDDILTILGTGKWNFLVYATYGLAAFMIPSFIFAGAFLSPVVSFQCVAPNDENITEIKECSYAAYEIGSQNATVEHQCSKWSFQTDVFPTSLTSEFELVCEKSYLRPTFQTVYMVGTFFSSPINGFLSDRFGRKMLFSIGTILAVTSMMVSSYVTNFMVLLILRFVAGFCHAPVVQTGYILSMEACEPRMRSTVGMVISLPWAIGTIWWGVIGYLIGDWRWLVRVGTIPGIILIFVFLWVIDESARWLIVVGDHYKALKVLKKAAKWNNALLPPDEELLAKMIEIQKSSITKVAESSQNVDNSKNWKIKLKQFATYIYILYKTPELRRRVLLMYVVFFVASTVYYGLSINAVNFQLNPYMYMVVGGLMEIPAYTITAPIIIKIGRIPPTMATYIICGVTIMALAFIPSDIKWLVMTLAMVAKLCITAAYQIIYLLASEVFPTEVRLQALGTSNLVSRIGSILAPYVTDLLGPLYPWMPSILFGGISILAGVATYFIPETNKKPLVDTILQLEEEALQPKKRNTMETSTIEEKNSVLCVD